MSNLKKILVAYDGSPHSKAALCWALLLGSDDDAGLEVVKVFEPINLYYDFSVKLVERYIETEKQDRQMMEELKSFCAGCGKTKVHTDVLKGPVAPTLLDFAEQAGVDLIVTGTKGHGALDQILMGSVTASLVSLSKVPVLAVKESEAPSRLQKILVAYDGSDCAKAALEMAIDIAKSAGAKILAVKVTEPSSLAVVDNISESESGSLQRLQTLIDEKNEADRKLMERAREFAAHKGFAIETELLPSGNVADVIIKQAGKVAADMIVAGTLGHGFLAGVLMGSMTRNLISLSEIPVLVVKRSDLRPIGSL